MDVVKMKMKAKGSSGSERNMAIVASLCLLPMTVLPLSATAAAQFKATIPVDGVYSINSSNLASSFAVAETQVVSWLQSKQIAVDNMGVLVPAVYSSNSISFFAQGFDSRYASVNTYWIRNAPGFSMAAISSAPTSVSSGQTFLTNRKVEQNLISQPDIYFNKNDDPWLWAQLTPSSTFLKTLNSTTPLPGASSGSKIVVKVIPYQPSGSNVLSVVIANPLNTVTVGTFVAQGAYPTIWTGSLASVSLASPSNAVRITASISAGQVILVDNYEIEYFRFLQAVTNELVFYSAINNPLTVAGFSSSDIEVFDITTPASTKRVTGLTLGGSAGNYSASFIPNSSSSKYVAVSGGLRRSPAQLVADIPSDLRNPANSSDYIAITLPAFSNAAQQLVNYRSTHGLSSRLVDVQDIYDEFNYGVPDPRAIRGFLGYAYYTWAVSPRYVVFVGEGSLDYKNYKGFGDCPIPPLIAADSFGLQASDEPMGDFNEDGATEIAIGRLPISSTQEFALTYSKILAYEGAGSWKTQMVCLADVPDVAGDFELDNDYVSSMSPVHSVEKNYIAQQPSRSIAHTNLLNSLNSGRGLMTYFGHGDKVQLTKFSDILTKSDVAALTNKSKPSLVLTMTCLAGDFGVPGVDALGETFIISSNGAVAMWAAGKQQYDADGRALATAFVSNLFMAGSARIGDAIIAATKGNTDRVYACQAYNLMGDPALAAGDPYASRPGPLYPSSGPAVYDDWLSWAVPPAILDQGVGLTSNDDADGDGIKNYDEYVAGTDPLDINSRLVITHASKPGSTLSLVKWNSSTRKKYDLERCTNILSGLYSPVAYDLSATPSVNVYTDSVGTASAPVFYRVRVK